MKVVKRNSHLYFLCEEYGFVYEAREWALKCEEWCARNKSCNMDIVRHAIKDNSREKTE